MQEPSMLRREASIATRLSVYILEPVIKHFPTGFDRTCRLILSVLHTPLYAAHLTRCPSVFPAEQAGAVSTSFARLTVS